jgi:MtN3 and saliva related transmembrane protein
MDNATLVGTIAAVCTTIAFLPQVVRIHRTKHTRDLSLLMFVTFSFGVLCWLIYGFLTKSMPVIIANGATLALSLCIILMKLKYG